MAKKISETVRKKIIADFAMHPNNSAVARMNGVSKTTVRNVIKSEPELSAIVQQKQEEATQTVLEYIESQGSKKIKLIGKLLDAMIEKAENVDLFTNIKDLGMVYGIIVDKEYKPLEHGIKNREMEIKEEQHAKLSGVDYELIKAAAMSRAILYTGTAPQRDIYALADQATVKAETESTEPEEGAE